MCFNIEYSCHTITNIIHGRRLSLQLMTNWSLTCNYSNACLPPMLIFPRVHFKREILLNGAPPGTVGAAYPTSWMTSDTFLVFLKHFVHQSNDSKATHVVLLWDNYESHISIEGLDDASENGVHMLSFCVTLLTQDAAIGSHCLWPITKILSHYMR